MNTETKILLTIDMEGGLLRNEKKEVRKYYLTEKDLHPKTFKGNGNRVIKSGKYTYQYTHPNNVQQTIKLCKEAYDFMTSSNIPNWFHSPKEWRKMSAIQRLETHLTRTARHFGGKSFTYQIVDD